MQHRRVTHTLLCWPPPSELVLVLIAYGLALYSAAVWSYDAYHETSFFYTSSSTEIWTSSIATVNLSCCGTVFLLVFLLAPLSRFGRALSFFARHQFPHVPCYEPRVRG